MDENTASMNLVWMSKLLNACCNLRVCQEQWGGRGGGASTGHEGKKHTMNVPSAHNSKIHQQLFFVNLGIYTSLETGENCNKCISAFVYTF